MPPPDEQTRDYEATGEHPHEAVPEEDTASSEQASGDTADFEAFEAQLQALAREDTTAPTPIAPKIQAEYSVPPGFAIEKELGRGGMGVVYLVRDVKLSRHVAFKMILSKIKSGVTRFLAEAEAVGAIRHPNVVQVYGYGEHDGNPYMILEYAAGGALSDRLRPPKKGDGETPSTVSGVRLSPKEAATLMRKVASGVAAAHEAGIVHRDLKPGNILIDEDGEPKVADFGLAKRQASDLTATDAIMGTPSYMAPEQAGGKAKFVGPQADVWALGIILYECITGKRPFVAETARDVLSQVLFAEPDRPSTVIGGIPRDLELICLKCLAKDPVERYPSGREMAEDLERFLEGRPVSVRSTRLVERAWKWARRHKALAALYAVLAVGTVASIVAGFWFSNVKASEAIAKSKAEAAGSRADAEKSRADAAGSQAIAARAEGLRARDLAATQSYFRLLTSLRDRRTTTQVGWATTGREGLQSLAKSGLPPGASLPELRTEAAHCLTAVEVSGPRVLMGSIEASALAFHPKGDWIAIARSKPMAWASCYVYLVDMKGELRRSLEFPPDQAFQAKGAQDGPRSLAVNSTGAWVVAGTRSGMVHGWRLSETTDLTSRSGRPHTAEVTQVTFVSSTGYCTGSLDSTVTRSVLSSAKPLARWKAPGPVLTVWFNNINGLIVGGWGAEEVLEYNKEKLQPVAGSTRQTGMGRFTPIPGSKLWALSSTDTLRLHDPRVVSPNVTPRILRAPEQENAHTDTIASVAVSPDGTLLASSGSDGHVRLWDLVSGRMLTDIPIDIGGNGALAWHPNGRELVVAAAGRVVAYSISISDCAASVPLPSATYSAAWSPDGASLATMSMAMTSNITDYRIMPTSVIGTGKPVPFVGIETLDGMIGTRRLAPGGLAFSPDGKQLAVRADKVIGILNAETGALVDRHAHADVTSLGWAAANKFWAIANTDLVSWELPDWNSGPRWSNAFSALLTGKGSQTALAAGTELILAGGRDGGVRLHRVADAEIVNSWNVGGSVEAAALSPDQTVGAVGTELGRVRVFAVPDGKILGELERGHSDEVSAAAFVSNQLLATGSRDGTIRFWTWTEGKLTELFQFRTTGTVISLAATRDGTRLAAVVHGELGARVWRLDRLRKSLTALGLPPGY